VSAIARFIEPMLLAPATTLPEGANWSLELKLDGHRALAIKSSSRVQLRSRNDKDFNARYPGVVRALRALPDETVVDGEVVAPPAGHRLTRCRTSAPRRLRFVYYVFDLLVLAGRDLMVEPLSARRALLSTDVVGELMSDELLWIGDVEPKPTNSAQDRNL
jgi:bifunctional non-homologous end joining protein LigD